MTKYTVTLLVAETDPTEPGIPYQKDVIVHSDTELGAINKALHSVATDGAIPCGLENISKKGLTREGVQ